MINASLFSSENSNWKTPPEVMEVVSSFAEIGVDPCAPSDGISAVPARDHLTKETDGLAQSWSGRGVAFINPPYTREIGKWVSKAAEETKKGAEVIMLIPGRVDTRWFEIVWENASAICFWRGRVVFLDPATNKPRPDKKGRPMGAPFPSAFAYFGEVPAKFERIFSDYGTVVRLK